LPTGFDCRCGATDCVKRVEGFLAWTPARQHAKMIFAEMNVRLAAGEHGYCQVSENPKLNIAPNGGMGQAPFATVDIAAGEVLFDVGGHILPFPTVYTICMTAEKHLLFLQGAQCIAHSCNPNVAIRVKEDFSGFKVEALRDIAKGELVSFNYLSTEWVMSCHFQCLCGHACCFGMINGFKNVPKNRRAELMHLASPAVLAALAAEEASA